MTGWSGVAGEHEFAVPDQARAQRLANALADYGFALVAAGPRRQGDGWGVRAYDYGPYPSDRVGYRGFYAVGRHAVALARQHGGYWTGGSQCDPSMMPSSPPDAPIVLANPGNRPPVPTLAINPVPPTARLALTPDRVGDTAADAADLTPLEDIPWPQLDHAHGNAADIPDLIRALAHQPDDFTAVLDELLGDDLLHQGTCYSATAPAMPFLTRLLVSGSLPASRRLELCTWLVFAAGRWAASMLWDADRAAAHHRPPAADPWTQDVHRAVGGELPTLLAQWSQESPALQYVLACLAALYPDQGRTVADEVAAMATDYANTQHGAYLQLAGALLRADDDQALAITRDILTWEDDLEPGWLDVPGVTAALRAGHILTEGVLRTAGDTD